LILVQQYFLLIKPNGKTGFNVTALFQPLYKHWIKNACAATEKKPQNFRKPL